MPIKVYQLGIDPAWDCGVDFRPDYQPGGLITFWEGHASGADGGSYDFATALHPRFRKDFRRAGADWFIPILERLARGEVVEIAEIDAACRAATGRSLPFTIRPD